MLRVIKWLWAMDTRLVEFTFGVLITLRGIVLAFEPSAMDSTAYDGFKSVMSVDAWAGVFLLAGLFQLSGIFINGHWRRSPWLRFAGASIGAICYAMLATLFLGQSVLAVAQYAPLSCALFWVAVNISAKT